MSATDVEPYHQPNGHLESGPQEMLRFPSPQKIFFGWKEQEITQP